MLDNPVSTRYKSGAVNERELNMSRPSAERLQEAKDAGATHVVVVCDTFSYEDYPVEVFPGQSVESVRAKYSGKDMQRVMEVIEIQSVSEAQLAKVNSDLRELQDEFSLTRYKATEGYVQVRILTTKNGDRVPAIGKKSAPKAKKPAKKGNR